MIIERECFTSRRTIRERPDEFQGSAHRAFTITGAAFPEDCATATFVLSLLGDKWSVKVLVRLGAGTLRFNEIRRMVNGISQRMLTSTLRNLEREGLVQRTVHRAAVPHVEYQLTGLGRSLWALVHPLGEWTKEHMSEICAARARFDASR